MTYLFFLLSGNLTARGKTGSRLDCSAGKYRMLGAHHVRTPVDRFRVSVQYVKQETLTSTDSGKEARATRLITERASRRIGKMAFELALARPRKVICYTFSSECFCLTSAHHSKSPSYTSLMCFPSRTGCSERLFVLCQPSLKLLAASIAWPLPNK
jgi:hypothetical protein